jgi:hypothetical protein
MMNRFWSKSLVTLFVIGVTGSGEREEPILIRAPL